MMRMVGSVSTPSDEMKNQGPICYRHMHTMDPMAAEEKKGRTNSVEIAPSKLGSTTLLQLASSRVAT